MYSILYSNRKRRPRVFGPPEAFRRELGQGPNVGVGWPSTFSGLSSPHTQSPAFAKPPKPRTPGARCLTAGWRDQGDQYSSAERCEKARYDRAPELP